jgi:lysophospholipase L1-like esterase
LRRLISGKGVLRAWHAGRVSAGSICSWLHSVWSLPSSGNSPPAIGPNLQWVPANDGRLEWINVADWEPRTGGLQPLRVPKVWREKWPERTAFRSLSTAGVAVRLQTKSNRVVIRLTFIDAPPAPVASTPEVAWELSRPPYFDVYRDGKYFRSVPALIHYYQQDVVVFDSAKGEAQASQASEFMILFPHYYRNAEVIIAGIGIDEGAQLVSPAPIKFPVVLFHGDSITHGHGATTPRETFVWQTCEMAHCTSINMGFGGSAWADLAVAEYLASRKDWDVLVLALGTNSLGGADSAGKPETAEQYGQKYDKFLSIVRARFGDKPIVCVTPILIHGDMTHEKSRNGEAPQDYRNAIQKVVEQRQKSDRNLYFIDGLKLINDPLYLLVTDQTHPNTAGSMSMAEGIAALLKPVLAAWKVGSAQDARREQ